MAVSWADIIKECDDADLGYRQRIVAIFRKYEGQSTDERDGSNRVVKVTAESFERHLGLGEGTLRYWLGRKTTNPPISKREVPGKLPVTSPDPEPTDPEPVEVPNPNAVRIPGRDFPHPEPIVVEHPSNPETPEPLGEFKAVMSVGDHRMAITSSILAMVELAQDSKGYEDDLADLFEATIQEIESALEALKSVVRTKSISIEDFLQ